MIFHRSAGDVVVLDDGERAVVESVEQGRLGSAISRLTGADGRSIFLKEAQGAAARDLAAEFERLQWLRDRLPVPGAATLESARPDTFRLVLEGLPGAPSHEAKVSKARCVEVLAEALLKIHALPTDVCPFRDTLAEELRESERRLSAGELNLDGFVAATSGLTPAAVLEELHRTRDIIDERVFTHGDYCLPNVLIDGGALSGVIDWGIAGLADPHRDFMAVAESLEFNLGAPFVARFFDAYGSGPPDPDRIRYYTLLDQFYAQH